MNSILVYGSVQGNPLYNCSVPLEDVYLPGTKRPFLGCCLIIFGIFVEMLYIPSFIAIVKRKLLNLSCYKIMFCLGLLDMFATLICSLLSGFLFIKGAVFCDYPTIIYIAGCLGLGSWMMLCAFTLLLVINRVSDIVCPEVSEFLFSKNRTWFMCMIPITYGLFFIFFTPAVCFNSTIMAWIGDPGIIAGHTADYSNYLQTYHNFVFIFSVIFLYTVYCIFINKKQMGVSVSAGRQVFIQSSIICLFNCTTSIVYIMLFLITPDPIIVICGELAWSLSHACPAFIYMTLNRTVRKEVFSWFKKHDPNADISTSRIKTTAHT